MNSCACNLSNGMSTPNCSNNSQLADKTVNCDCPDQDQIVVKGVCPSTKVEALLTATDTLWTQVFIPEVLCIPAQKPNVEELLTVTAVPEIISQRVVKTPVLTIGGADIEIENKEGIRTTGRKLVLEGLLRQKVIYVADVDTQSVHAAHFDLPFSAFIILPANTALTTQYRLSVCIEDIFICQVTRRSVFKNVTLFIKAEPLVCIQGVTP